MIQTRYLSHQEEDEGKVVWLILLVWLSAPLESCYGKMLYRALHWKEFVKIILMTKIFIVEFCLFAIKYF